MSNGISRIRQAPLTHRSGVYANLKAAAKRRHPQNRIPTPPSVFGAGGVEHKMTNDTNNIISTFEKSLQDKGSSPLTILGYLADTRFFLAWFEEHSREDFALEAVTPGDAREYQQYLQNEQGLKANTVNRKLASLSALMNWAVQSGRISADPTAQIKYVKKPPQSPKWLDKQEQYALQRAVEKDLRLAQLRYPKRWVTRRRDASIVNFMLNTGLRLSEMISLKLDDLAISERKGQVLARRGKDGEERVVPLNAQAREAVSEWLKVRPASSTQILWLPVESETNEGLTPRAVQRVLKRYGQDAGIENLTPYSLRHSFAKNLANKGVGVEKIARLLGHKNLNAIHMYVKLDFYDWDNASEYLE